MVTILFVVFGLAFAGPCNMEALKLYSYDETLQCIREKLEPLGPEVTTIPIISEYYNSNIYVDYYKNPPFPFEAFDLLDELKKINDRIGEFNSSFDFYNEICITLNKLKDCHVVYRHSCLLPFYFTLPFFFEAVPNPQGDEGDSRPYFRVVDHSTAYITAAYLNDSGSEADIRGNLITDIDPLGGDDFQPAYKVIYDYGLKNERSAYNYHALYNSAIRTGYYMRRFIYGTLPPKSTFTALMVDANGENQQKVELSWYAVYQGPSNVSTFEELCPPYESSSRKLDGGGGSDSDTGSQSNGENNKRHKNSNKKKNRDNTNSAGGNSMRAQPLPPLRPGPLMRAPPDDNFLPAFSAAAPSFPFAEYPAFVPVPPSAHIRIGDERLKGRRRSSSSSSSTGGKDGKDSSSSRDVDRDGMKGDGDAGDGDGDGDGDGGSGGSGRRRKENTREGRRDAKGGDGDGDGDDGVVFVADVDSLQILYLTELNVGYVNLSSFDPEWASIGEYLEKFPKALKQLRDEYHVTDLIIDVRGNGGGYAALVSSWMNLLFASTLYPADSSMDVLKTDFMDIYSQLLAEDSYSFDILNTLDVRESFYEENVTKEFKHLNGTSYNRTTSKPYVWSLMDDWMEYIADAWGGEVGVSSLLSAQHVYVVTNGQCYSACGIFTKDVIDSHSGRVLGFGVHPDYTDRLDLYDPGSCPALSTTSTTLDQIRTDPDYQNLNLTKLPPTFASKGTYLAFSSNEIFSVNANARNQNLYFRSLPVHDVIPGYTNYLDNSLPGCLAIAKYIYEKYIQTGICFPGEIQDQPVSCAAEAGIAGIPHAVFGYRCNNSTKKFDDSSCVFSHCEDRYFEQTPQNCVVKPVFIPQPSPEPSPEDGKKAKIWIVPVVVVPVVVVVIVIGVVIGCLVWRNKKGKSKEEDALLYRKDDSTQS